MTFEQIIQLILGSTGALVVLVLGIKWLDKDRNRIMAEWREDRGLLQTERDGRLTLIEESNARCAEDRIVLHKKIDGQQEKYESLLKAMIGPEHLSQRVWAPKASMGTE